MASLLCLSLCLSRRRRAWQKDGEKPWCATRDSPLTIFCLPGVLKSSTPGVPVDGALEIRSQDAQHIYMD